MLPDLDLCAFWGSDLDWLGIVGQLLELHPPAPINWIRSSTSIPLYPGASSRGLWLVCPPALRVYDQSADEPRDSNAAGRRLAGVIVMSELMLRYDRCPRFVGMRATRKAHLSCPFYRSCGQPAPWGSRSPPSPIGEGPARLGHHRVPWARGSSTLVRASPGAIAALRRTHHRKVQVKRIERIGMLRDAGGARSSALWAARCSTSTRASKIALCPSGRPSMRERWPTSHHASDPGHVGVSIVRVMFGNDSVPRCWTRVGYSVG